MTTAPQPGDLFECQLCGVVADGAGIGRHLARVHEILDTEETIVGVPFARVNEEQVNIAWRSLSPRPTRTSGVFSHAGRRLKRC